MQPVDVKEMARRGGKASQAKKTPEERSAASRELARARWGEESETTKLAKRLGISRQAAWARLNKKGKKKRKKG